MSRTDTTIAQMTAQHAIFGVRVKIALAFFTLQKGRLAVLREHLAIIQRREAQLGVGTRPRRKASPEPERLLA